MFQIRENMSCSCFHRYIFVRFWPVSLDLIISPAGNFTSIRIVAFLILITFDLLGMKFPVVPESAIAFLISLRLLWVDAFVVIWTFFLVSFTLANASPLDPQFYPLFLSLIFFVSAQVALATWLSIRLKHWGILWFVLHPHDQHYPYLIIDLGWIYPFPVFPLFPLLFPRPPRPPCWWFCPLYWSLLLLYHPPCLLLLLG